MRWIRPGRVAVGWPFGRAGQIRSDPSGPVRSGQIRYADARTATTMNNPAATSRAAVPTTIRPRRVNLSGVWTEPVAPASSRTESGTTGRCTGRRTEPGRCRDPVGGTGNGMITAPRADGLAVRCGSPGTTDMTTSPSDRSTSVNRGRFEHEFDMPARCLPGGIGKIESSTRVSLEQVFEHGP